MFVDPFQLALGLGCMRWRNRAVRYRPPGEVFSPDRATVALIDESSAKVFCQEQHYAHTYPPARVRVGLFIKPRFQPETLGGVAVFSVSMSQHVVPKWLGVSPADGIELGRFVLLDHPLLAANAESWFLKRAFRLLRSALPTMQGVVAFCDPMERRAADGTIVKRSHTGIIYRAHNATFAGRTAPRQLLFTARGTVISERAVSKLRNEESGAEYVERQLITAGCTRRNLNEDRRTYLARLQAEGQLERRRSPGNLAFTWAFRSS